MGQLAYPFPPYAVLSLLGVGSLGFAFLVAELPGRAGWVLSVTLMMVLNLLTFFLALARASADPRERAGWRLFAAGVGVALLAKAGWFQLPGTLLGGTALRVLQYAANPLSSILMAAGVWRWPWRERRDSPFIGILGSLVFCLSFFQLSWIGGAMGSWGDVRPPVEILAYTLSSRLVLVGGMASFFIAEDPRRLRGPLGWLLLNSLLSFAHVSYGLHQDGGFPAFAHSAMLALGPLTSGILLLVPYAAWPAEARLEAREVSTGLSGALFHLPFLAVSGLLVVALAGRSRPRPAVLIAYLALTVALVVRQFLLQERLAASHRDMESRVAERTKELERMQDVVLLNERLNAVVVLGAGLVHDLNKGLDSILSAAEVIQMEMERRMKVSGFAVEAIIQAVERSAMLSSRVMDFSRRLQEEGEVRDLRRELAALEGLLRLLVPCHVHLLLQPGQEPAPVRIHTEDLKQILLNLVANARDALPTGGTIRVAVGKEAKTGETYLDVEDTGVGIPEEHREHVFEPFFTTKDPSMATGLGLASVKVLLERAKGRVEVSSAMGQGTRFRLLFPSTPAHAA
jgi:signal transduction histidine kinase